jgi:hypothetical protein
MIPLYAKIYHISSERVPIKGDTLWIDGVPDFSSCAQLPEQGYFLLPQMNNPFSGYICRYGVNDGIIVSFFARKQVSNVARYGTPGILIIDNGGNDLCKQEATRMKYILS